MTGWLVSQILGPFLPIIAGIFGALGLIFFGRRSAKKDAKIDNLQDYRKTRERIDHAPSTTDPDIARNRMRDRDPKRP